MYAILYGEKMKINVNDLPTLKIIPGIQFFENEIPFGNLLKLTIDNNYFRKVINTGPNHQIVLMSLLPGQEIGKETHYDTDQFFRIEQGKGIAIIDGIKIPLIADTFINVKQGSQHNIINNGKTKLKLYTIYSPAHHPAGLVVP
jgi:mannose-6-phosphate isomerase-like protein (cupin superfamily)